MTEIETEVVTGEVVVPADPDTVQAVVSDVRTWPQHHPSAVHAEVLGRDLAGTLVQHWALADRATVRAWTARWTVDAARRRIRFVHKSPRPPLLSMEGEWAFTAEPDGGCRTSLTHTVTYAADDGDRVADTVDAVTRNTHALLETARDTAARREELRSLVISFTDTLYIDGRVQDAYAFLHDAGAWPERLPHVKELSLEEPAPGVQFFDMTTAAPDGSEHTTRSVRITLAPRLIVYKQLVPPALLSAHTGHWSFVETPEGVLASARHTATIEPSALPLLGADTTVRDARRHLRRVLSGHSVRNLTLAGEYARESAHV